MDTKYLRNALFMAVVMLLVSACGIIPTFGSRNLITESRDVSGFNRVEVSGGGSMDVIQDGTEALTVETDDNLMPFITSEVRGGTLYLGMDSGLRAILPSRLHFTLHVKDLAAIGTSGSWDVVAESLDSGKLTIIISGSGGVAIGALAAEELTTSISGSGELDLAGEAGKLDINISGSGKVLAGDLRSQEVNVRISGSGNVTVWAITTLTVDVSGSGTVNYYGQPQVSFDQSGSGSIHNLGEK